MITKSEFLHFIHPSNVLIRYLKVLKVWWSRLVGTLGMRSNCTSDFNDMKFSKVKVIEGQGQNARCWFNPETTRQVLGFEKVEIEMTNFKRHILNASRNTGVWTWVLESQTRYIEVSRHIQLKHYSQCAHYAPHTLHCHHEPLPKSKVWITSRCYRVKTFQGLVQILWIFNSFNITKSFVEFSDASACTNARNVGRFGLVNVWVNHLQFI